MGMRPEDAMLATMVILKEQNSSSFNAIVIKKYQLLGVTPLHYACLHGHLAVMKYLVYM